MYVCTDEICDMRYAICDAMQCNAMQPSQTFVLVGPSKFSVSRKDLFFASTIRILSQHVMDGETSSRFHRSEDRRDIHVE